MRYYSDFASCEQDVISTLLHDNRDLIAARAKAEWAESRRFNVATQYLMDTRTIGALGAPHYYKSIQCIKLLRMAFDLSLKDAKELVDDARKACESDNDLPF